MYLQHEQQTQYLEKGQEMFSTCEILEGIFRLENVVIEYFVFKIM